jgi:hypothetical protein
MVLPATFRDYPFAVSMSRCDGLNVGMLLMSLIKPVEIRVTVAPVSLQSDNFKCLNEAVVADINVDGILGLDFLKSQHAEIDMCNNTITIQGHKIQLNIQGQIWCYRVTVSETVVLPPQSEIVVNGKVNQILD